MKNKTELLYCQNRIRDSGRSPHQGEILGIPFSGFLSALMQLYVKADCCLDVCCARKAGSFFAVSPIEPAADPADHGIHKEQKQQEHADIVIDLYRGIYDPDDKAGNDQHDRKGGKDIERFLHRWFTAENGQRFPMHWLF